VFNILEHIFVGPGPQALPTLFLLFLFLFLLLSDFQSTNAFFISKPIVIKLRIQIEDNILHNRNVSDFQVVPIRIIHFNHQIAYTQQHQQQRCRCTGTTSSSAAIQQCRHLPCCSVAASDDTWRIEMKCAFLDPTAMRCCSWLFYICSIDWYSCWWLLKSLQRFLSFAFVQS